jgi:hypothetical protein
MLAVRIPQIHGQNVHQNPIGALWENPVLLSADRRNKGGDVFCELQQQKPFASEGGASGSFFAGAITCLCALQLEITFSIFLGCTKKALAARFGSVGVLRSGKNNVRVLLGIFVSSHGHGPIVMTNNFFLGGFGQGTSAKRLGKSKTPRGQ